MIFAVKILETYKQKQNKNSLIADNQEMILVAPFTNKISCKRVIYQLSYNSDNKSFTAYNTINPTEFLSVTCYHFHCPQADLNSDHIFECTSSASGDIF